MHALYPTTVNPTGTMLSKRSHTNDLFIAISVLKVFGKIDFHYAGEVTHPIIHTLTSLMVVCYIVNWYINVTLFCIYQKLYRA